MNLIKNSPLLSFKIHQHYTAQMSHISMQPLDQAFRSHMLCNHNHILMGTPKAGYLYTSEIISL